MGLTGALLLLAGRSFEPMRSTAAVGLNTGSPAGAAAGAPLRRKLGELTGQSFRILVHASLDGPRYTVISPDGVILAERLSESEMARDFPALELDTMTAEAPDADPNATDW
jgi:hypothetical protein